MASKVVVRSLTGKRFTQEIVTGKHTLLADEPEESGGSDRGPGPYESHIHHMGPQDCLPESV